MIPHHDTPDPDGNAMPNLSPQGVSAEELKIKYESLKEKWSELEKRLIDKIAETENESLMDLFCEWQTLRNELNDTVKLSWEAIIKENSLPDKGVKEGEIVFVRRSIKEDGLPKISNTYTVYEINNDKHPICIEFNKDINKFINSHNTITHWLEELPLSSILQEGSEAVKKFANELIEELRRDIDTCQINPKEHFLIDGLKQAIGRVQIELLNKKQNP